MKKYSIIIEYKGGTFVSQTENVNETKAMLQVFKNYCSNVEWIDCFDENLFNEIESCIKNDLIPVLLDGLDEIWYFNFSYQEFNGYCHIVGS